MTIEINEPLEVKAMDNPITKKQFAEANAALKTSDKLLEEAQELLKAAKNSLKKW